MGSGIEFLRNIAVKQTTADVQAPASAGTIKANARVERTMVRF